MKFKKSMLNVVKENGKVIEFTIDRRFWKRGAKNEENTLLNVDGTMCCLGFYERACNVSPSKMKLVAYPDDLSVNPFQARWLDDRKDGRKEQYHLADVNDNHLIKDHRRQQTIRRRFARQGITVHFVN